MRHRLAVDPYPAPVAQLSNLEPDAPPLPGFRHGELPPVKAVAEMGVAEFHRFRPARIITVGEILLAYPLRLPASRNRDLPDIFPDSVAPPEILLQLILQIARFERVPERGEVPFSAQRNPISVIRLNRRVYDRKMRLAPRPSVGGKRQFCKTGNSRHPGNYCKASFRQRFMHAAQCIIPHTSHFRLVLSTAIQ